MDKRVKSHSDVIDASKILVEEGLKPRRIVLRKMDHEYVTHIEVLTTVTPEKGGSAAFQHESFESGNYFRFDGFGGEIGARAAAVEHFIERVRNL